MKDSVDFALAQRFAERISQPNALVSTILRAHLEIEAEADRLLRLLSVKPETLDAVRLTASQKFKLCEALWGNPDCGADFWHSLERLNVLRNEIAHGLREKELEEKLRAFIATIAADEKTYQGEALENSLVTCLCYLFHDMSALEKYCQRT